MALSNILKCQCSCPGLEAPERSLYNPLFEPTDQRIRAITARYSKKPSRRYAVGRFFIPAELKTMHPAALRSTSKLGHHCRPLIARLAAHARLTEPAQDTPAVFASTSCKRTRHGKLLPRTQSLHAWLLVQLLWHGSKEGLHVNMQSHPLPLLKSRTSQIGPFPPSFATLCG